MKVRLKHGRVLKGTPRSLRAPRLKSVGSECDPKADTVKNCRSITRRRCRARVISTACRGTVLAQRPAGGGAVYELELLTIVQRVRSEYEEMPGLALTIPQAARLWRLDDGIVEDVMATLVDVHYLCLGRTGF